MHQGIQMEQIKKLVLVPPFHLNRRNSYGFRALERQNFGWSRKLFETVLDRQEESAKKSLG
jgi:hypothetical protein